MKKYLILGAIGTFLYKAYSRTKSILKITATIINVKNVKITLGYASADIDVLLKNEDTEAISINAGTGALVKVSRIDILTKSGEEIGQAFPPQEIFLNMPAGGTQRIDNVPLKIETLAAAEALLKAEEIKEAQIKIVVEIAGQTIRI